MHRNWQRINYFLISVTINIRYHSRTPIILPTRYLFWGVFKMWHLWHNKKFSWRNTQVMNTYFVWYVDKNIPDYKYLIPLCIKYACKIVMRMERLSKDGLFNIIQYVLSMQSRRSVNYYRCPISKYAQLINKGVRCLVTDVTRSSCIVIFKRMSTIKGQMSMYILFKINSYWYTKHTSVRIIM